MKPAADELSAYLQDVSMVPGQIPVLHNADVAAYNDSEKIKDALVRQLYSPVRWVETLQMFYAQGIRVSAECGPGRVLAGLTKRTNAELSCIALTSQESLVTAQAEFNVN